MTQLMNLLSPRSHTNPQKRFNRKKNKKNKKNKKKNNKAIPKNKKSIIPMSPINKKNAKNVIQLITWRIIFVKKSAKIQIPTLQVTPQTLMFLSISI